MLIPRTVLFGNPSRMNPQVSPDGVYIAYIAPNDRDVLQVWLRTLGREDDRVLTSDKKRGIRTYFWTFEPDVLFYLQDADGDENWHLYSVNVRTDMVRDLTPFQGIQAQPVSSSHRAPEDLLVGMNLNDRAKHDSPRIPPCSP
jgi:Tol biopolymer transport system component